MADEVIHQNPEVTDEFSRAGEIEDSTKYQSHDILSDYVEKWWLETLQSCGIPRHIFEGKENQ